MLALHPCHRQPEDLASNRQSHLTDISYSVLEDLLQSSYQGTLMEEKVWRMRDALLLASEILELSLTNSIMIYSGT